MKPLTIDQWDNSLQHVVDDMQGDPLNIHRLLANHPELLRAWWPLRMHSVTGGNLDQRDCELIILRVAVLTETWYEWAAHVDRGLVAGLSRVEIDRVAAGPAARDWDERDRLMLTAVDELFHQRCITPQTLAELGEYLTERRVLDIVSLHGVYMNLACILKTWDVDIESRLRDRLPADVTEDSFAALLAANGD
ncbi:MAG: carboxymuconolactone decarboxylase family protein [Pseudomonadota bacterium]